MSAVFFVETAKAVILFGIAVTERSGVVSGTVIDEKYLKISESLDENAVQTLGQIEFYIIYGYDDG